MKRNILTTIMFVAAAVIAAVAMADGGGMGGAMMGGGGGMLAIADDGSVLVTEMGMGGGMMGGPGTLDRELIAIGPDGQERWRVSFDDGWPMMLATDGDLVVLSLADSWWMGWGGMGDGGWRHGGGKAADPSKAEGQATLVALSVSTGAEQWRLELDGEMLSMPQFTEDGSRIYATLRDMDGDHVGGGPMDQGDTTGWGMLMSSTLVAVGRDGTLLWSIDLDDRHMGGPMAEGGLQ